MKLTYIDSCIWIARVEGLPRYKQIINETLKDLAEKGWIFCASELVALEVLAKPLKENNDNLAHIYRKLFEKSRVLKSYSNIFRHALLITQTESLKGMDAIHVAFADRYNCKRFVSIDPHFRNLKIVPPLWVKLDSELL